MSRLIDADALMKSMYHRAFETDDDTMWQSGCWVRYRAIEQTVKEQPTIEPKEEAKTPRWVAEDRFVKGSYFEYPRCPKCNGELATGQCYCSICGQHIDWDEEEGADG